MTQEEQLVEVVVVKGKSITTIETLLIHNFIFSYFVER